jgi:hypothetical protein
LLFQPFQLHVSEGFAQGIGKETARVQSHRSTSMLIG